MGKWLNNIGRMVKKKDGGYFMVFERRKDKNDEYIGENPFPLTVNEGDFFQLRAKKDDLKNLVETGKISQEVADKICETVKFEISRAPAKSEDSKSEAPKSTAKSEQKSNSKDDDDEVNF